MKLRQLFLQRYGSFTDKVLDFYPQGSTANLHLIYGPNEAGKSTALQAMTDLRFGFQHLTGMAFLHNAPDLSISAILEHPTEGCIGLTRVKKRTNSLQRFAVEDSSRSLSPADGEIEAMLQAGLNRNDFEQMYGVDHARLRSGGQQLISGEGDLGSALFEASAGTAGVKDILQKLEDQAAVYYKPRGQAPVINKSLSELTKLRSELKKLSVRPQEWETRRQRHQASVEAVQSAEAALETVRRDREQIMQLRNALPTVNRIDVLRSELQTLKALPDLPSDVKDRRIRLQQDIERDQTHSQTLQQQIANARQNMESLEFDEKMLSAKTAINRLCRRVERYEDANEKLRLNRSRSRERLLALQARADRINDAGLDAVLQCIPEKVRLTEITEQLERFDSIEKGILVLRRDLAANDADSAAESERSAEAIEQVEPQQVEDLDKVVLDAGRLGDIEQRIADLLAELSGKNSLLVQRLRDLQLDEMERLEQVRTASPLLDADIQCAREQRDTVQKLITRIEQRIDDTERECSDAQARIENLQAEGTVVTSALLEHTRAHRDRAWQLIYRRYIEVDQRNDLPAEIERFSEDSPPLPVAFQTALSESDRVADALREDTGRSTRLLQDQIKLERHAEQLTGLKAELNQAREKERFQKKDWCKGLALRNIPTEISPDSLQQWQSSRHQLIELDLVIQSETARLEKLQGQCAVAHSSLRSAMLEAGLKPATDKLGTLVDQAGRWMKDARQRAGARKEQILAEQRRSQRRKQLNDELEARLDELGTVEAVLKVSGQKLGLHDDASARMLQVRLDDLTSIEQEHEAIRNLTDACLEFESTADVFRSDCKVLAAQLEMATPVDIGVWIDELSSKLAIEEEAFASRQKIEALLQQTQSNLESTADSLARNSETLDKLMASASVNTLADLEQVEDQIARRQQLKESLQQAEDLLRDSSQAPEAELRTMIDLEDAASLERKLEGLSAEQTSIAEQLESARESEIQARREVEATDTSDAAAEIQSSINAIKARVQDVFQPWSRLRVAHALLQASLSRYRERAQGPMIHSASEFFALMTQGVYSQLVADEDGSKLILRARSDSGRLISIEQMSEGTADQLYLALRLAALKLRANAHGSMPLVLDDVLMTSDDERASCILQALDRFGDDGQVFVYTHHRHLLDLGRQVLPADRLQVHEL